MLVGEHQGDENGEQFIIADEGEGEGDWWLVSECPNDLLWPIIIDNP